MHIASPTMTGVPVAGRAAEAGVDSYAAGCDSAHAVIEPDGHRAVDSLKAGPLDLVK